MTSVGRDDSQGFALWASSFFRGEKGTKTPPGVSRGRLTAPAGPPPAPLFTGDTPTPLCKISGAQNTAPGFDSFRATGPWFCAKFRFVPFHSRAWFRPAVAEGAGSCPRRTAPFPRTGDGRVWDSPLRLFKRPLPSDSKTRTSRSWKISCQTGIGVVFHSKS